MSLPPPNPFAGDDGRADARLGPALATGDVPALVAALPGCRLFTAVVALDGDVGIPTLRAGDGRTTLPVFSSVAALAAWDARARPVPAQARRIALSAVAQGHQLLVVDPATAALLLPRPAVWALAQDLPWIPSPTDPSVLEAVEAAAGQVGDVLAVATRTGRRAELAVVVSVSADLDAARRRVVAADVSAALAACPTVAERVDSLEISLARV